MRTEKNNTLHVQVKPTQQGASQLFSFELPAEQLKAQHLKSFLQFITSHDPAKVMKGLISVYFTAVNDDFCEMDEETKMGMETPLSLLTELSIKKFDD